LAWRLLIMVMSVSLDISTLIARKLLRQEIGRARIIVNEINRTARLDGDLARARLASSVATQLYQLDPAKGRRVDLIV
jgi:hypothetical protein